MARQALPKFLPDMPDVPRRQRLDHAHPAESVIRGTVRVVEGLGAHPRLTDAVIHLLEALDSVADYLETDLP